jgi:hypothetical protein
MGRGLRSVCEYKLVVNCDSRFCRLHVRIELRESFQMVAVWKTCVLKESRSRFPRAEIADAHYHSPDRPCSLDRLTLAICLRPGGSFMSA